VADRHSADSSKESQKRPRDWLSQLPNSLVFSLTPDEFREMTRRAMRAIEDVCGVSPKLYRGAKLLHCVQDLLGVRDSAELGLYSRFQHLSRIVHDRYGVPGFHRHCQSDPYTFWFDHGRFPLQRYNCRRKQVTPVVVELTCAYFLTDTRLRGFTGSIASSKQPACVYTHPWELDPDQPRMAKGLISSSAPTQVSEAWVEK